MKRTTYTLAMTAAIMLTMPTMMTYGASIGMGNGNTVNGVGSVVLIGENNQINAGNTNIIGANNTLGVSNGDPSGINVMSSSVMGQNNTLTNVRRSFVAGRNWNVNGTGAVEGQISESNVLIGDNTSVTTVTGLSHVTAVGANTVPVTANSVYLGSGSTNANESASAHMESYPTERVDGLTLNFAGATPAGLVSIGREGNERRLQNLASGKISETSTDAINGSQLYALAKEVGKGFTLSTSASEGEKISGNNETILPGKTVELIAGKNLTVLQEEEGKVTFATKEDVDFTSVNVGNNGIVLNATNGVGNMMVAGPNGTVTNVTGSGLVITPQSGNALTFTVEEREADGTVKAGTGISAGNQQIHNVAAGTAPTDAVNVSQLRALESNVNVVDNRVSGVAQQLQSLDGRVNRVGAQAAALGALKSIQYDPLEPTQIMAGVGYYKGESSLALGLAHYKNESTMIHTGLALGGRSNEWMANAGITWKFGSRADETAVKDTFRQGPISASYTLQDKISSLEEENKEQKQRIVELQKENESQRTRMEMLEAKMNQLLEKMG